MLTPSPVINSHSLSALGYTAFGGASSAPGPHDEEASHSDHSSQRSTSATALPDPSQQPARWQVGTTTPALSSADSSSASTRSSAYTGSAKSGDYGHVHVALGEDESAKGVGVGITTDEVVQLLSKENGRTPVDQSRWSDFYQNGLRSRSSSLANSNSKPNSMHEKALRGSPSFDMGWQRPDERDEQGLASDEDTDEDPSFEDDEDDEDDGEGKDDDEEPTSAAIMAEDGRGVIIHGHDVPVSKLHVSPETTHLLIGSSPTQNAVPSFLATTLPQISASLLALDISANFLSALPPALSTCERLEELNIASNPLRVLPTFLATLDSLRVLIVDATGLTTLPANLASLEKLHTLSVRRNKMHSLPSWLCILPALETLLVDGNPFQGPWKALMEPLLSRGPLSPTFPPSTPIFPLPSASMRSMMTTATTETDDSEEADEDLTVTSPRAPNLARSITAPTPNTTTQLPSPGLSRTRTTPNRAYFDKSRSGNAGPQSMFSEAGAPGTSAKSAGPENQVRRMKSAGELHRNYGGSLRNPSASASSSPQRPALTDSNLLTMANLANAAEDSLGVASGAMSPTSNRSRRTVESKDIETSPVPPLPNRVAFPQGESVYAMDQAPRPRSKHEGEKNSRWGFLKKMSMGKMRPDQPVPTNRLSHHGSQARPGARPGSSRQAPSMPVIDARFSTTGAALHQPELPGTEPAIAPNLSRQASGDLLKISPLDQLKKASTEAAKQRRSFLPIDMTPIPIPNASQFVPDVTATNSHEEAEESAVASLSVPSPVPAEASFDEIRLREEERAREARIRALRSVMSYLRDMHDLSQSATQTLSMYGGPPAEIPPTRSRRPTMVDGGRILSEASMSSMGSGPSSRPESMNLRQTEGRMGLSMIQTNSVATTDSIGSGAGEERKCKDDKSKRVRVIQEIVETEKTYVKQLQELVDIYIKPATATITILSGVSQIKDTVVPSTDRKIVFGGLESLYYFHKESFLPALERAAHPLAIPSNAEDARISLDVARHVANTFTSHAAFMKMYSTSINNFDNSVARLKQWVSDKPPPAASTALSPSSSTAQLASLGMGLTGGLANVTSPDGSSKEPPLSSSQRKRLKQYLKRCKMNPRHSQISLESYLLLPVQRIPRYRMLLEQLVSSSPPASEFMDDPIERALAEISGLATTMNEGKRDAESRGRLVQWQGRIRGKFPSPLVQPHRRLIMDGPLHLTRVVRKATVAFEVINAQGDSSSVEVECLSPELTPRSLIGILCNDLLVLCRDPSEGQDPSSSVDLWAVLRMQTLPQPASIVHASTLRLVDNKAILYFDAPSTTDALTWFRAINLHIPASKA
ncbi:uncharacterized protein BXZ73DRAFT_87334 [Epithele typhae]|uniref:uncharacterized protein n=1 Tax=Epithele typhae TaxID=378194 RepID=UPI0020076998|nr:uncharacterized protein BXZ73DRAFT_87334 [Epithele typhae]KAH9944438.1 hypothetical protein BXZ73DRAFT_87334 [Epithele typhae]